MKKAVFVSSILPFPVDAAKKVTVSGIMKYLCERYGVEHVAYVLIGELDSGESLERSTPYKLLALGKPGVTRQIWNVLWFSLTRRTKSIQESMLYSAGLKTQLLNAIRNLGPAIVICDTLRVGQFLETPQRPAARYVLHLDDLLSIRYQKMEKDLTRFPEARLNPLGDFSKFVPTLFQSLIKMRYIQKWVLRLEQRLVEKREENCVKWFDTNLLVSKEETSLLRSKTKDAPIRTIKPLLQNPRKAMTRDYDGEPTFVFLGRLDYPPNQLSIVNFITTQMDRVIEKIPECRLRVIGKGGDSELLKLAEKYRGAI